MTPHGTPNRYNYHGCRCEECKSAKRQQRAARVARGVPEYVHGTVNGYTGYDCRCERCRAAAAAAQRQYYHRYDGIAAAIDAAREREGLPS